MRHGHHSSTRSSNWEHWLLEHFRDECAYAISASLNCSTRCMYSSTVGSYIEFCNFHQFPICPTPNTLSFYIVFMSYHIKPSSIKSYLSGICSELESIWPDILSIHTSAIVSKTLAGCQKLCRSSARRKHTHTEHNL